MDITKLTAYELIEEKFNQDFNSKAYLLKHIKSGARVSILENDDRNKVFYIAFRTPPKNSTGVAHILEHSVLCGSEKYPTKDPFADLCKSSLNTFLNAMTYPDKTVYPVASCNDKDFSNLMKVYMDAVFKPNIYKEKKIFMQEGWHYELNDPSDELKINGVVYNEMKGAFSSPDDVEVREVFNSLFPDTAYGVESGGDPDNIPDLTYEEFLEFHAKYYHPSNSYIYLYGNADMIERLNWLDEAYLSSYDSIVVDSFPGFQKPFEQPRELLKNYSIAEDDTENFNTYLSFNAVVGNAMEVEKSIAFSVIDYALCDAQGSPLKQRLIDAAIGKEIDSSFENGIYQHYYSILAKNANKEDKDEFVTIINEVCNEIIKKGFDKNALKAGLNGLEFKYRESDFGSTPKGLVLGLTCLESWLYDDNKAFELIECNHIFADLKKKIETDYYEKLLEEFFVNNNHKTIVIIEPKKGLGQEKDEKLALKLNTFKDSLSKADIQKIIDDTISLKAYQEEGDTKEDLAKIPRLSREDISPDALKLVNEEMSFNQIPGLYHEIYTNGISYVKFMFKLDKMPLEMYSYYSLLSYILAAMDTANYSYEQIGYEIDKNCGGLVVKRFLYESYNNVDDYNICLNINFKCLYDKIASCIELIKEFLLYTKFNDYKRLKDLIAEIKSQNASSLISNAHIVASNRASSYISELAKIDECISGIDFQNFINELYNNFDEKKELIVENLIKLMKFIFNKKNLFIDLTCDKDGLEIFQKELKDFADCLYTEEIKFEHIDEIVLSKSNEGISYSGMVQYVAKVGNFRTKGLEYDASLKVLKTIMSYDFLWNEVRIKGGAYGCLNNYLRNGICKIVSYRDPNLKETYEVYNKISEYIANFQATDDEITNYIIATVANLDIPHTPASLANLSFSAYLSGLTNDIIQRERDRVLATTVSTIRSLAKYIDAIFEDDCICTVGNANKINENKDLFKNIIPLIKA